MIEITIILVLILFNGILSMSEIALVSARKSRLEAEAKKGNKSAKIALELSKEPDKFFSTIQIGITLIGILTGLYSGEAFALDLAVIIDKIPDLSPYSLVLSNTIIVIVVTYLTLILGELVPKRLGMAMSEKIAKLVAKPMFLLSKITSPFVWLLSKSSSFIMKIFGSLTDANSAVTEDEIKAIVKEGYHGGEVLEVEHDIVGRVFSLGDRDVSSIMTHRGYLTFLDITDNKESVKTKVQNNLFTTYPVISKNLDNIIGVVFLKDLFKHIDTPQFCLEQILHAAHYIPETKSVYDTLEDFKTAQVSYGIVVDEFGATQGIVTLKDITEGLIGEVDIQEDEKEIVIREDGTWLVDGQYSFYNFLEYFKLEHLQSEYEFNTLSGLLLDILEHIPRAGEKICWRDFKFEIMDMDGARIDKVLVTRIS